MATRKKKPPETKPARTSRAVLDLDTTFARRSVLIDGDEFELRDAAEFSVLENHRQGQQAKRIGELQGKPEGELSEDEVSEIVGMLDGLVEEILLAPADVRAKLSDVHKLKVVGVFTQLQASEGEPAASESEASPSTGGR